jgi:hypothetical protein
MDGSDRELRDRIEQLQAELAAARASLSGSEQREAQLARELAEAQEQRGRAVSELERTRSEAADAQAAFEHLTKHLDRTSRDRRQLAAQLASAKQPEEARRSNWNLGIRPDFAELNIRSVAGGIFGLLAGLLFAGRLDLDLLPSLGVGLLGAVVNGYLAGKLGDRFWLR